MKRMMLILAVVVTGCEPGSQDGKTIPTTEFTFDNRMITLTHDGHRYVVVMDSSRPKYFIHHPDCCKPPPL